MEPALGRRSFRLAVTLEAGLVLLVVVALWADPAWVGTYTAFVAVTAVALAAYMTGRPKV
jgi:hypothetical protein